MAPTAVFNPVFNAANHDSLVTFIFCPVYEVLIRLVKEQMEMPLLGTHVNSLYLLCLCSHISTAMKSLYRLGLSVI